MILNDIFIYGYMDLIQCNPLIFLLNIQGPFSSSNRYNRVKSSKVMLTEVPMDVPVEDACSSISKSLAARRGFLF